MRRRLHARPRFWLLMIAVMVVGYGISIVVAQNGLSAGAQRLAAAQQERNALSSQVNALRTELDFMQTDAYVERVARDELGMIKPGEIRYVSK